jgi:hypothetical protein
MLVHKKPARDCSSSQTRLRAQEVSVWIIDEAETIRGPVRIEGQQKTVNISNIQDTKKWVEQGG